LIKRECARIIKRWEREQASKRRISPGRPRKRKGGDSESDEDQPKKTLKDDDYYSEEEDRNFR
jgi:hypothetical protein